MILEVLDEDMKHLWLTVSWTSSKFPTFRSLLGDTVWLAHACGGDTEVLKGFRYFGIGT